MKKTSLGAAVALIATIATPSALAADTTDALRAVRDKATGEMRAPNNEEMKALMEAEKAQRKARGLPEQVEARPVQVRTHASGMKSAVLGPDYMVTVQSQRDPSGNPVVSHANPAYEHTAAAVTDLPTK